MRQKIKRLAAHPFIQGGAIITGANFIIGLLNYLFNSLTAKILGPAGYGEITALFSYLVVFSVPFGVIVTDVIRRTGRLSHRQRPALLTWEDWLWSKIYHWRGLIIPYFLLVLILPRLTNLGFYTTLTLLIMLLLTAVGSFYSGATQGLHFFGWFAAVSIISVTVKLAGPLAVKLQVDGIFTILFFLVMSNLTAIPLYQIYLRKKLAGHRSSAEPALLKKRLYPLLFSKTMVITTISLLALNLFNNLDMMFAKKFFSPHAAGLYGAWNLFAKIVLYVSGPLSSLSFIYFSSTAYRQQHRRSLFWLIGAIVVVGALMLTVYTLIGKQIVTIIFSASYYPIISFLPQAALFGCLYTLVAFLNGFFLAKNARASLILAVVMPFYALALLLFAGSFSALVTVNLIFAAISCAGYLLALAKPGLPLP
ncbi:oligosaccharide flippase family protein [Patescibacteria group bacterium]|nr:oligosaccharide flippase family protein [Patescibacteria group bacterium]MCL5091780.1 oligosaccharide flippase family protein [Patescibacteria group bacterium]